MTDEYEYPEVSELVVCTVREVMNFGAFVELDEYGSKEGLIHISEIASGWIKHIRDHIREGQKVVCKVLHVDAPKGHVDLSFKDVNKHQRREKVQAWKNEQKALKWMDIAAESAEMSQEERQNVVRSAVNKYGSVHDAFEDISLRGNDALHEMGVEEKYAEAVLKVAEDNVKSSHVEITGYVDITTPRPDGVSFIKKTFKAAERIKEDDVDVSVTYVGAPTYRIHVKALDYKTAENILKATAEKAIKTIEKYDGSGAFRRHV